MKKDHKVWLFVAAVVILIILLFLRRRRSGSTDTAGELAILRDKIKNMETYKTREGYTSPNDNNGLTIAGTILEQFLDVSIEVFNQPLVKEMLDKIIKDSGDARVLATVIEDIGGAIKESIKKNDLLQCLTKLDCREKKIESGEGVGKKTMSSTECRIGDTDEFVEIGALLDEEIIDEGQVDSRGRVKGRRGRSAETIDWSVSGSRWHSSDTKNCHRYRPKQESFMKIAEEVANKIGEMLMDPEKQKLYYDTFIQIGKDNTDFITSHNAYQNSYSKGVNYINPFGEGGEFKKQFPREHALGEMTKVGQGFKNGRFYRVQTASQTTRSGKKELVEV